MTGARRAGLAAVSAGVVAQALAMALALVGLDQATVTNWLAIAGVTATLAGVLAMGASRGGTLSRPAWFALLTVVGVLLAGFGAALHMPDPAAAEPLWLGLPRRAAIVLLGVGLLPVLVLPACFALDFRARDESA